MKVLRFFVIIIFGGWHRAIKRKEDIMQKKIMLDAGHYGKQNQSPVVPEYYESVQMWRLLELLAEELELFGFTVLKTRERQERDKAVVKRGEMAKGCDLFLSLHSNATGNGNTKTDRVSVYAAYDGINGSHKLARILGETVAECMGVEKSYVKTRKSEKGDYEYYGVMRGARSVGCPLYYILEHSFHTNERSANWLMDEKNLKRLAIAEAAAIALYFGLEKFIPADVDLDGNVDIYDAVLIKRAVMNTVELTEAQRARADLNGDGEIDIYDYIAVKKKIM